MEYVFWAVDLLLPTLIMGFGLYYLFHKTKPPTGSENTFLSPVYRKEIETARELHAWAGKAFLIGGAGLCVFITAEKLALPFQPESLSIVNNTLSIVSYVVITTFINRHAGKDDI